MGYREKLYFFVKDMVEKNFHRTIKYSIAGFIGFLIVELSTFILFHFLELSNLIAVTSSFLIGVAVEFLANEYWTTRNEGVHTGNISGVISRLIKFEVMNLAGTSVAVAVQYILYITFGLTPLIGNLIGSAVSFPISYYIQMRVTWGIEVR